LLFLIEVVMTLRTAFGLTASLAVLGAVVGTSVQARQAATGDTNAALLEEVRAIRAEMRDAAANSMRAQLVVARLSLQEQRISALNRDLSEVQTELRRAVEERGNVERQLKELQQALASTPLGADLQRDISVQADSTRRALSQRQQIEQDLRLRESEVMGAITTEQNRWNDFNARLDDLERAVTTRR
jgi:chromosome segregation ATPase